MTIEEIVKLFSNLALLGGSPAGQAFLLRLAEMKGPSEAELHASIQALKDAIPPPEDGKGG